MDPSISSIFSHTHPIEFNGIQGRWMDIPPLEEWIGRVEPMLSELERKQLGERVALKRKTEFLSIRFLKNFDFQGMDIHYAPSGKPFFIPSDWTIGISHSKDKALWCYATKPFGCDIECYDDRILKVGTRFSEPEELKALWAATPLEKLTCLWSCKEAIYKLGDFQGIDWKKDMRCVGQTEYGIDFMVTYRESVQAVRCNVFPFTSHLIAIATYV
ncbi:MAG: 4'-phosphopantetheinyl transferase family protein [Flavobacteriales bacterium]